MVLKYQLQVTDSVREEILVLNFFSSDVSFLSSALWATTSSWRLQKKLAQNLKLIRNHEGLVTLPPPTPFHFLLLTEHNRSLPIEPPTMFLYYKELGSILQVPTFSLVLVFCPAGWSISFWCWPVALLSPRTERWPGESAHGNKCCKWSAPFEQAQEDCASEGKLSDN